MRYAATGDCHPPADNFSMQPEPTIAPLPAARIGDAVDILKNAFHDDPIFGFHFPDPAIRLSVLEIFFDDIVRAHMRFHHVYAATAGDRLVGTAVWRPPHVTPDTWLNTWRDRMRGFIARRRLMRLAPEVSGKLLQGFAALEATHPAVPHWYLFFIGLDPGVRGQGVGARLMAPVLDAADVSGAICHLETPFLQTLGFYRKLGYEVSGEPRPFPGAPQLWTMTRQPSRNA